ncbi:hypothetical protein NEOC65_002165 [Neochlamydia sp. AcF65]|nr:hypothetical protein [Neochlamydia sp. AcF65]
MNLQQIWQSAKEAGKIFAYFTASCLLFLPYLSTIDN